MRTNHGHIVFCLRSCQMQVESPSMPQPDTDRERYQGAMKTGRTLLPLRQILRIGGRQEGGRGRILLKKLWRRGWLVVWLVLVTARNGGSGMQYAQPRDACGEAASQDMQFELRAIMDGKGNTDTS